ncbi:hypothetical protein D2Q93_15625 [Alicyclobacillaceae bacterium I2511]|nr:hypothetical protein D2Q93_15625 [Alicyclobacillaceae bacterium I2511]
MAGSGTVSAVLGTGSNYSIYAPNATSLTLSGGSSTTNVEIYAPNATVTSSGTFDTVTLADPVAFINNGTIVTLVDAQPGNEPLILAGTIPTVEIDVNNAEITLGTSSVPFIGSIIAGSGATLPSSMTVGNAQDGITIPAGVSLVYGFATQATVTGATV